MASAPSRCHADARATGIAVTDFSNRTAGARTLITCEIRGLGKLRSYARKPYLRRLAEHWDLGTLAPWHRHSWRTAAADEGSSASPLSATHRCGCDCLAGKANGCRPRVNYASGRQLLRDVCELNNSDQPADLSLRLRRIEEALAGISSNLAALTQAYSQGLREVLFSQAAYLGDHRALTYLRSGLKIFVDTRSVDIGTHLMLGGHWEADYMTAFLGLLKPGDKVLDVGANHGVYALLAAQKVGPTGHVFAFEASRNFCELMRASVSVNGFDPRVTVINSAVADREFDTELLADLHWSGGGHLASERGEAPASTGGAVHEKVHCISLDDYFADPADRIDAVKMDVEGAEGLVLKGMAGLIDRSPNLKIMMEFSPAMLSRFACDATFVREFFESRGFMCWTIRPDGSLAPAGWGSLLGGAGSLQNIVVSRQGPR